MRGGVFNPFLSFRGILALACITLAYGPGRLEQPVRADTTEVYSVRCVARLERCGAVAGVSVSIMETGDNIFSSFGRTAADGSFSADVPAGTYTITAFGSTVQRTPSDLLDAIARGVEISSSRSLDLVVRHGTVIQTSIITASGVPMPGARIDVVDDANEIVRTAFADSTGWVRCVAVEGQSLFVTPSLAPGGAVGRWARFEELARDGQGRFLPIRLDELATPVDEGATITAIFRGSAPGPHVKFVLVSEGFTDIEESFTDRNGNGVCDNEPFLDLDGNGRFNAGDRYVDTNGNGKRDGEPFDDTNGDGVCNRGERALFIQSALDHVRMMFAFPGYRELREAMDVDAVFLPSRQAGSDFPSLPVPVLRDTEFDSRFLSLNFIFNFDKDKVEGRAREIEPDYDVLGVIVYNLFDTGRETGGGTIGLFSARRTELTFTCAHEVGHSLGRLADEYFDYDGGPPYDGTEPGFPNITRSDRIGSLKWSRFVRPGTPVPTSDAFAGVGAFEGGYYRRHGIVRPALNCMMRKVAQFCPVCVDALLEHAAETRGVARPDEPVLVSPIAGATVHDLVFVGIDTVDLARVDSVQPLLDGAPFGDPVRVAPFGALLDSSDVAAGAHTISAEVSFTNGSRVSTPPAVVSIQPSRRSSIGAGSARIKGGTLQLEGFAGLIVPGAALLVDGGDRFPLEPGAGGIARVVKSATGSVSGLRFKKAVRAGRSVTIDIVNGDGGRAAPFTFTR